VSADTDRAPAQPKDATDELENGLDLLGKLAADPVGTATAIGEEFMDSIFGAKKKEEPAASETDSKPALRGIDGGAKCT
jgi:hypothetical protein